MGNENISVRATSPIVFGSSNLPIIFHYINSSKALSRSAKDSIQKSLANTLKFVNQNFANQNGSQNPNAMDTGLRFYLTSKTPSGGNLEWLGLNFVEGKIFFKAGER